MADVIFCVDFTLAMRHMFASTAAISASTLQRSARNARLDPIRRALIRHGAGAVRPQRGGHFLGLFRIYIDNRNRSPVLGQPRGDGRANPLGRPGHQGGFALQAHFSGFRGAD